MTILEMIAEWRKGCSDAGPDNPELCHQCTRGLIDAIERKAIEDAEDREQESYEFLNYMERNE